MNKGDTLRLILDYSLNGVELKQNQFEDLELQLNKETYGKYHIKLRLSQGDIGWEDDLNKYVAYLPQSESMKLSDVVEYQLRCYRQNSVLSSNIRAFRLGDVLSRTVLPDGTDELNHPFSYSSSGTLDDFAYGNINQIVLQGQIIGQSVSFVTSSEWGKIYGDINDQEDLIAKLSEREESDVAKIATFFAEHPDYNYRFLLSIANQPIAIVKDYIQLIIDDKVQNGVLWIPYEVGKMCLIIRTSTTDLKETIRFYVPATGEIGSVDISDPDDSGAVKFRYQMIGDSEENEARWGSILGTLENQEDLSDALDAKLNREDIDVITKEEIEELFGA